MGFDQTPAEFPERFSTKLGENLELIKKTIGRSSDVLIREFNIAGRKDLRAAAVLVDGMIDKVQVDRDILESLMYRARNDLVKARPEDVPEVVLDYILQVTEVMTLDKVADVLSDILSGNTAMFFEGHDKVLMINTKGWPQRSVQQPISEPAVRGPRDSFTENIRTNTAILRRRINDPDLIIKAFKVGTRNQTHVSIAYLAGVADADVVANLEGRIKAIKADRILGSGALEELLSQPALSPFPKGLSTERPDRVAGGILQGQIAVLTDNTPFVLLVPAVLPTLMQASDDYYHRWISATFIRLIRTVGLALGLFLPSLYVALAAVNPDIIPLGMALAIAASREGIPYPAIVEVFLMDLAMELLSEASSRLPTYIGASATVVGGLIIGTAAAQARIISNIMIIVVAATAIGIFTMPNYELALAWRMSKFILSFLAAFFGLYGVTLGFIILLAYLVMQDSFGIPYLSPVAPVRGGDLAKDMLWRAPWWRLDRRPRTFQDESEKRGPGDQPGAGHSDDQRMPPGSSTGSPGKRRRTRKPLRLPSRRKGPGNA